MRLKIHLILLIGVFQIVLIGCSSKAAEVKDNAQIVADAFNSGDILDINKHIFGEDVLSIDEAVVEIWGETQENKQVGLLSSIFSHDTVTVKQVNDKNVVFEIEAPNMENVFLDISSNLSANYSEEEMLKYIQDYINNTEIKKYNVEVPYSLVDGNVVIEYQSESFINAVTGGLLNAYKQLYLDAIEKTKKGLE